MNDDEPATDSGGSGLGAPPACGGVRLRLDIAYDGTEFAGWAVQAGQRTVAGVLDKALSTVFRTPVQLRAAGRTDTGVHATGQVAHVDVPVDALAHAYPRTTRAGRYGVSAAGAPAGAVPAGRCACSRHRPCPSGFRRPVLRAAPALRVPAVHRPVWRRAAGGALRDGVAAPAGCRRDGGRLTRPDGAARLRRVLPASRRRDHDPRPAAAGLVARRRLHHRVRHRRRVLLVDGALAGRCPAGGGRAPPRTRLVRCTVDVDAALQRLRGRTAAGTDAGRRRLSARRPTRGTYQGHPRSAGRPTRAARRRSRPPGSPYLR